MGGCAAPLTWPVTRCTRFRGKFLCMCVGGSNVVHTLSPRTHAHAHAPAPTHVHTPPHPFHTRTHTHTSRSPVRGSKPVPAWLSLPVLTLVCSSRRSSRCCSALSPYSPAKCTAAQHRGYDFKACFRARRTSKAMAMHHTRARRSLLAGGARHARHIGRSEAVKVKVVGNAYEKYLFVISGPFASFPQM